MSRRTEPRIDRDRTVSLPEPFERWSATPAGRACIDPVRRLLGLDFLDAAAERGLSIEDPDARQGERFARGMGAELDVDPRARGRIPATGPLIVVANHPFGFLDAAAVCWLLDRRRPDVMFLANRMLERSPLARGRCFFVDAFGGAARSNAQPLRDAMRWVREGGCLAVFPAGQVMASPRPGVAPEEAPWNPIVARLVERTGATVLPLWVHGSNSRFFHAAGHVHPMLRTALLPLEARRKHGARVRISVGAPVPPQSWRPFSQEGTTLAYLRARAELAAADDAQDTAPARPRTVAAPAEDVAPSDEAWMDEMLRAESVALASMGGLRVIAARGREIPGTMRELGRLRELTFRSVGEGTGHARDIDQHDPAYWQLVLVDSDARRIVGGYRLGLTHEIVPELGVAGLYTNSLFEYGTSLLDTLGPSIELGRSFVVPERQREAMPLHLLWRAIGQFIAMNPSVQNLFGPVSISSEFSSISRDLLTAFLDANRRDAALAQLVTPRTPPSAPRIGSRPDVLRAVARTVDEVDELVNQLEGGARGIPPLLRHYLRLDAKVLAFNVDSAFGDCLDALVTVHVPSINRRILSRYFGPAMDGYLAAHGIAPLRAAG